MVQRSILLSALAASLLGLTACGGGSTGDPTAPPPADLPQSPAANEPLPVPPTVSGRPQLGGVAANGDLLASALAVYTIEIDPGTLSATARLKETRQGAANDDLYLLSIGTFLKPDSFTITRVSSDGTTLDVGYEVKHPFPAPSDPTGTPNGSTNRADLGIAGMVLFTVDVPGATGNTYFDEGSSQVIANTQLVTNPDAYYRPAGLLTTGSVANTFPYKLLVDETADPRTSGASGAPLSNGGDVTGNFGTDGWTRAEFGSTNDGWTGYGFLHQGQVAGNTISLDRATLVAAGSMRLDAAIIAKYQDPRGGANGPERKANRLPPATPDHRLFAYRGNHAALDVERIAFAGESGGFVTNQISASTLRFQVADWDARASETTAADLSEEADATLVAPGESGLPGLAVSIPGVLGDAAAISTWDPATDVADDDSAVGGDAAQDSGRPGDPLFYTRAVTKLVTSGQSDGTYVGMVRATDPEQAAPLALPLDGTTLTPLTSDLPDAATYQAFTVEQITPNSPPTLTLQNPAGTVASGNGVATFNVTAYNDPNGDPVQLQFDWNNDGDFSDTGEALQTVSGATPVPFASPIFYNNATLTPAGRSVPYRYTDGVIPSPITGTGSFTLGPNQAPTISAGTVGLANPSLVAPATFSLTATGLTVADAEGDAITFTVTADANNNGSVEQTASSIVALAGYNATPVMGPWNSPNSPVRFRAYANDATHAGTAGTAVPSSPATLLGTVTPANNPPTLALQNPAGPVASGNGVLTFNVTSYNDPDGNTIQIQFDWNNDGDFSDTGEALQTVSGATPVPFSSPIFYNNATLTPAGRSVPYRYTDGVIATPLTGTGSFTLGANQGPTFAGTVGLQTASLVAPATFTLTTSGFSVTDPEGDAVSFTVTADANNNGSVEQTGSNVLSLSGYNATPVMGPWAAANSPVRFRAYANDALHAGTSGTALTTSPATLLGTVTNPNSPPTLSLQNPAGTVASGDGVATFNVTAYNDPDGNTVQIQFDWNNDGDFSDTGEGLQTVSGATPVPFSSPIFYNNPTLTPAGRSVPYRYTDGIVTPITSTGSFTLGANQSPTFAGTVGLQTAILAETATFQLTTSGFSVTDPEGDALSFTVTADAGNDGSVDQSAGSILSLSGYNATPVMGPWTSPSSPIRFRAYANDALHAGTSGTALATSPSPLLGTVTAAACGLDMSAVNTTLETLTTGNVVRTGTAADQPVAGVRIAWTDVAGEAEYVVQRGAWANGTTVASVTFTNLATVAANATSYDDTAVNTQGTRYLYRVVPRCVVGSTLGTPSQLAMVALQDFEGIAAGTDLLTGTPLTNGWTVNYNNSAGANQVAAITATALGGARSAEFTEVSQNAPSSALTLSPPHINDRAGLGTIGVSRFEMMHSLAGSAQQNVGYTILTNTGRFANNTSTTGPQLPNNWRWMNPALLTSFGYNDATNSGLTNQFSNIAPAGNFNFGVGAAVEAFTAMDCTAGTITNAQDYVFIAAAATTTNPDEQMRFDDLAWIVY